MAPQIKRFKGLNNVSDPLRLGLAWLAIADNVNITDTGAIKKREGFAKVATGVYTGAYTTLDFQRMYLIDGGSLKTFDGTVLKTGLSDAPFYWAEINKQVFFNNGVDRGVILPDNTVLDWAWAVPPAPAVGAGTGSLPPGRYQVRLVSVLADGRRTGAGDSAEITLDGTQSLTISGIPAGCEVYITPADSTVYQLGPPAAGAMVWNSSPDALGPELLNIFLDPIPVDADVIAFHKGVAYAAQYVPGADQTIVWFSEPLGFHLFNLSSNFFIVPGHVHMLADADTVLMVGTESKVYAYTEKTLAQVADYGVIPGQHWELDKDKPDEHKVYFWTARGLCTAMPFMNLTERQVSVAPGVRAGGAIVRRGGQKRYVVSLQQGGAAFNPYV